MYRNGLLNSAELEEFDMRRIESTSNINPVDIYVFLRATPQKLRERIIKRAREMEKGISQEYLSSLNELYENKLLKELQSPESQCKVLIYNVDDITPEQLA